MKCLFSLLVSLCLLPCFASDSVADLVLKGGEIITLDDTQPRVTALAARNGRIIALGDAALAKDLINAQTEVIDLKGATAIPGFIEGHAHLISMGTAMMNLRLMGVDRWDKVIDMVRKAAEENPPGTWIEGRGWHQDKLIKAPPGAVEGYPVHQLMSKVSPNHPVMLKHASGHALFANVAAMKLAGVDRNTPDPEGGKILRDAAGEPTGVFEENAMDLISDALKRANAGMSAEQKLARKRKAVTLAMQECLAKGITSFQDAGSDFDEIALFKDMADAGDLDVRLWVMASGKEPALASDLDKWHLIDYGNHFLTVGGIKCYADGALGSRGAWLLKPYHDLPGSTGQAVTPMSELEQTARLAKEHGFQLCVHAIGDRGNREVLNLYERVLQGEKRRWRIEHAQHIHPDDVPRFAELGVIASMQGVHCTSDAPFVPKRLGDERAKNGAYVWRKLLDSGAVVTNGTDAPVEDVSALASYYSMVSRKQSNGEVFYPEQALKPMEALRAYTLNNAYASFQEKDKGSLEKGKLADITVLDRDITRVALDRIPATKVLYTIVGGRVKFRAP